MHADSNTYQGIARLKRFGFLPAGILDVGAYDGNWSRGARAIFPDAHILMIDALIEKELILNAVCADLGNADSVIALLGAEDRAEEAFYVVKAGDAGGIRTGSSRYKENTSFPTEERRMQQQTLNSVLALSNRQFQFVKLDVQGSELDVLCGASAYLHRTEAVLMEVATLQYNSRAPLVADVIPTMQKLGFVLFDVLDNIRFHNGCLFQFDALFIKHDAPFRPKPPF
jgi:FkbM family methyltransferase